MKNTNCYVLWLFVGTLAVFVLMACSNGKTTKDYIVSKNLMVKTIADTSSFTGVLLDSGFVSEYEIGAEVDYPVDGPQPLTDSVRQFVIKELYCMFDLDYDEEDRLIPFEKVCEWKGDNIVTDFLDNYGPFYEKEIMGVGASYLSLRLVVQTETFITYFGEYNSCGASCATGYCYYTFRKQDGHMLKEIISKKKLKAFVKDHPVYNNQIAIEYNEEFDTEINEYFSMLKDGVVFVNPMGLDLGELWEITIPYSEIKPYLTKQAQELVLDD